MAIRWRNEDITKLRNHVRKFNAKITREIKKNPKLKEFLPERLNVNELRDTITTRRDFNNIIKSVNRFMDKKATQIVTLGNGVSLTRWEKRELQYKRAAINNRKREQRKIVGEVPKGRAGTLEQYDARDLKRLDEVPKAAFEGLRKRIYRESTEDYKKRKDEQMLANWTQAVFNAFGDEKATKILKMTEGLERSELLELILSRDDFSISFMYEDIAIEDKYNYLLEELDLLT